MTVCARVSVADAENGDGDIVSVAWERVRVSVARMHAASAIQARAQTNSASGVDFVSFLPPGTVSEMHPRHLCFWLQPLLIDTALSRFVHFRSVLHHHHTTTTPLPQHSTSTHFKAIHPNQALVHHPPYQPWTISLTSVLPPLVSQSNFKTILPMVQCYSHFSQHHTKHSTMPSTSHLRHSTIFDPIDAHTVQTVHPSTFSSPPEKKRKMTITQTYFLAHTARGKLSHEAARGDHDLRLLVGHANLLDALTVELQEAEREQDAWFEKTVAASRQPAETPRVQFKDAVAQKYEEAIDEDIELPDVDSDADSEDSDAEDEELYATPVPEVPTQLTTRLSRRSKSPPPQLPVLDEEDDDFYDDVDMENEELTLTRVASRITSPPELVHEDSDDSEDEEMAGPVSPPATSPTAALPLPADVKTKDFAAASKNPRIQSELHPGLLSQSHVPAVAAY